MRHIFFIAFILVSIVNGYSQNPYFDFDYKKSIGTAVVVESRDIDSLTQMHKVVLEETIPFYHYLNKRNSDNTYVILMHGLGGNKNYWVNPSLPYLQYTTNLTAIKDSLMQLGFNIVIIDAKYHGERSYELNFRNPGSLPPAFSQSQSDANIFYDLYVSTIKEVRLIMDYVENRIKDSNLEFNLIGYSMGGAFSLILNSIDERINCVVACVPPLSRPYSEVEELRWSGEIKEKMKAISPLYYATDQNSPLLMLMGKKDPFIPMDEVREFYRQIPISDKKLKFYDSGHELPDDYINAVISWITEHNRK